MTMVVTLARQAEQTAEDARILAEKRKQGNDLADAQRRVTEAEARAAQAEAAAQTAQTQASAATALLDQERAARRQAEAEAQDAASAAVAPPAPPPSAPVQPPADRDAARKKELRLQLYEQLNTSLPARDTPRGVTLTLADSDFRGARVNPAAYARLAQVAVVLRQYPELVVEVDGNESFSSERAQAVREILVGDGLPAGVVVARGLGDSRPLTSNATAAGREQNRRVEIVVSGSPIGDMPYWAKSYRLAP
jgi:outer membrane protein OmpA-like peptidoglycan-associated protein